MEDWNEVQQEEEEWQLPDEWRRILQMVFCCRDIEINPVGCGFILNTVLNNKGAVLVSRQIPYEIFIYVEGGISDPNFEAG